MRIRRAALSALVLLAAACATGPQGSDPSRPPRSPRDVLTYDQLAATQLPTMYDAIQRLQPSWLRAPTGGPSRTVVGVFVNGARVGEVDFLRQYPATQAQEVRYLTAQAVQAELPAFQNAGLGGAIMITARRAERSTPP